MTNPFHHSPPSGFNSDSQPSGFLPLARIRSSYASALSSTGSDAIRPNSLHHLLNPASDAPPDLYATRPPSRTYATDVDRNRNAHESASSATASRPPQLPSFSRAFEMFMNTGVMDNMFSTSSQINDVFFVPSYLRGSNYVQKLEEAHKAKQYTQKEVQQQAPGGLQGNPPSGSISTKPPASHLGMAYDLVERAPSFDLDSTVAPLPAKWNKDDKMGPLEVSADGLEVKCTSGARNPRELEHEAFAIRADHPMPVQAGIYYFEVTLMSRRRDETSVCVGFGTRSGNLQRLPGWEPDSYGYHGDDGEVYSGSSQGKRYLDTFGPGDIIGCGVNFFSGQAFFTKNGKDLGIAFHGLKDRKLYPEVGMKKPGEHVRVNFGQAPFVYNIDLVMKGEQALTRAAIASTRIDQLVSPPVGETELIQQLVLQFLQHDGYVETARAFAEEIYTEKRALNVDSGVSVMDISIRDDEDAHHRQRIRRAILEGDIDKALKLTNAFYHDVLPRNDHVYFKLKCRKFIEMVRKSAEATHGSRRKSNGHSYDDIPNEMDVDENGDADQMEEDSSESSTEQGDLLAETVEYGRLLQAEYKDDRRPEVEKALRDVFALLAYENPLQEKEIAPLLDRKGRVSVAEELNSAILSSLGKSSRSALENLYGQTSVLLDLIGEDGGPGSFVTIQSIIDGIPKSQPF
ncbi:SPRY domain-containing protein [Xylariaceae sp. FL0016]|nr:SPRY domain-containing protein [Xylariaceae sp. FL0016]